jgi:glycosyltransferase involved in cell wall biosynthesis
LAPEKNLPFLTRAVCRFLRSRPDARFLLVGDGPSRNGIRQICTDWDVADRLHDAGGTLEAQDLANAYHAMDVFAFASHSETQGMVLAEAMTAGVPVVAVDAPGAREVVRDTVNGRLLSEDDEEKFAGALSWCVQRTHEERHQLIEGARRTAEAFAMPRCARRLLAVYRKVVEGGQRHAPRDDSDWAAVGRLIGGEWKLLAGMTSAVGDALFGSESQQDSVQ